MHILDHYGRKLDNDIKRDVTNVRALTANNIHSLIYALLTV